MVPSSTCGACDGGASAADLHLVLLEAPLTLMFRSLTRLNAAGTEDISPSQNARRQELDSTAKELVGVKNASERD